MKKYFYSRGTIFHSDGFVEESTWLVHRPYVRNSFGVMDDEPTLYYRINEVKQFDEMWEVIEVGDLVSDGTGTVYYVHDVDKESVGIDGKADCIMMYNVKEIYKRSADGRDFHRVCHFENDEWKMWQHMIYCYRLEKSSLVDAEHAPISEKRFISLLGFIHANSIQMTFNAKRRSYYILIEGYETKQDFSEFLDKYNNTVL